MRLHDKEGRPGTVLEKDSEHVISRMCELLTLIGEEVFDNEVCHDCFCEEARCGHRHRTSFRMDGKVLAFAEIAIEDAISRHKKRKEQEGQ